MARRTAEPVLWLLFSAGGVASALFLPALVFLFGLAIPLGWIDEPGRDQLLGLVGHPLTALILLLRPLDVWWVTGLVLAVAGLAIVFERVRRHAVTWWLLSFLVIARIVAVWPLSDNHIYLLAYWCAAIGVALMAPMPAASLADGSRWLLGAAFALAPEPR